MSKFAPAVGDVNVIGTVDFITANPLGTCGFFLAAVSSNGYASVQQDKLDAQLRFCCPVISTGFKNGDAALADIAQLNGIAYATNVRHS